MLKQKAGSLQCAW